MRDCTPYAFWQPILTWLLPPGSALLSAIALWVGSRARTTSKVALSTLMETLISSNEPLGPPKRRGSRRVAPDLKKS